MRLSGKVSQYAPLENDCMATPINLSVMKAFDVLDLFDDTRRELTTEVVARELRLSHATAHRFLATLDAANVLTAVRRGSFAPGPRLARLGRMAEDLAPLPRSLQATLDRLRQALEESVMACRYTPRGPLCVAVSQADRPISVNIRTGTTLPMLTTAQGRLFLAGMTPRDRQVWARVQGISRASLAEIEPLLEGIRAAGHAVNRGDNEPDIAAVSVPVIAGERTVLTVSAFGTLGRFGADVQARAAGLLVKAASDLAREIDPARQSQKSGGRRESMHNDHTAMDRGGNEA
ncbi:IclR family transcriptional regulator [Vannielia litorea]|uniref:Transcriptional regulator, IclR family n=1 Tax=Vannielia litorea TaxID=1217970 RepID=A0A1N6DYL4_9RHOB|nr:IclR family transcriptional regulator C-terminal domain-containing protein [Vannielia litorea]SIN75787.1 transcriptional regulator, IclR family [Vannielia litorea]